MMIEEFRAALHDGLGRALRDVRSVPREAVREILLDACLHNRAIDPQLDSDRSAWLVDIMDATGEFEWIAPRIVGGIPELEELWDVEQALNLAVRFAQRGVSGAREAVYAEFDRQRFNAEWLGGLQLVVLDGIPGFLHVAQRIGRRSVEQEYYIDDYVEDRAAKMYGAEAVAAALNHAAQADPHVARYALAIERQRAEKAERRQQPVEKPPHGFSRNYDFDAVRGHLDDPERGLRQGAFWINTWGRYKATDSDLERALDALVVEKDPARQRAWLFVFSQRAMPRFEPRVLELLHSEDGDVSLQAHVALGHVEHAEVRRVAIERLESGRCDWQTVSLLISNYRHEDEPLLVRSLPDRGDREALHELARAVNKLIAKHGTAAESRLLAWSYDHAGCTNCREDCVKKILELGCAPAAILDECRFDSSADIRELARLGTKGHS
jgi:hypothetical protein